MLGSILIVLTASSAGFDQINKDYTESYFSFLETKTSVLHSLELEQQMLEAERGNEQSAVALRDSLKEQIRAADGELVQNESAKKQALREIETGEKELREILQDKRWLDEEEALEQEKILGRARGEVDQVQIHVTATTNEIEAKDAEILALQQDSRLTQINSDRQRLDEEIAALKTEISQGEQRQVELEQKIENLPQTAERIQTLQSQLPALQERLSQSQQVVSQSEAQLAELEANSGDRDEVRRLRHYLGLERSLIVEVSEPGKFNIYPQRVSDDQKKLDSAKTELESLTAELESEESLRAEILQLEQQKPLLQAEIGDKTQQRDDLEQQRQSFLRENLDPLLEQRAVLAAKQEGIQIIHEEKLSGLNDLESRFSALRANRIVIESSDRRNAELKTQISGLKGQLAVQVSEEGKSKTLAQGHETKIRDLNESLLDAEQAYKTAEEENERAIQKGGAR